LRNAIVVSAFLCGGSPRTILDAARRGTLTLFTSAALIAELEDVLSRAKFAKRIADAGSSVDELLGDYLALAQLVRATAHPPAVTRDPDDDHVIACALAADAEVIVSSDDDLLTPNQGRGQSASAAGMRGEPDRDPVPRKPASQMGRRILDVTSPGVGVGAGALRVRAPDR
jgi:uncharacterized protein